MASNWITARFLLTSNCEWKSSEMVAPRACFVLKSLFLHKGPIPDKFGVTSCYGFVLNIYLAIALSSDAQVLWYFMVF